MEVLFDPFPKQLEFLEAVFSKKYRVIVYGGAIRGGKTFAGIGALILLCKMYPGSRWAIVRDTLPTLKRNTIPSFFKCCPKAFIKSHNQETQTVTLTNGSQIIFFPENYNQDKDLNRWKGLEVSGFLLEEFNELQHDSFNKALERAGAHIMPEDKKPPPLIIATCNPSNGWVKELIYDRYINDTLPAKWLYISSRIFDNPFATRDTDYMEQLQSLPRLQYEKFVNGDWELQLKTGGEMYKCFELDKHVAPVKYDPALALHFSWDDNVNPYLPCGIFQVKGKQARMIDEVAGKTPRNTVAEVCKEIARRYPAHESGVFIYGDSTANKEDTKLEKGIKFYTIVTNNLLQYKPTLRMATNPSVVMRCNWINTVFEKNIGGIEIIIGDNCKNAITDFVNIKEASDGTKLKELWTDPKTKVRYQRYGHFTDLFDYFMCRCFEADFAKYKAGALPSRNMVGRSSGSSRNGY